MCSTANSDAFLPACAQIGFGGTATSPFRPLPYPNQRVATSSAVADIGQPLAVARTATQVAVVCETLVQLNGNPYQCGFGYCNSLGLYFKNWCAAAACTLWLLNCAM